MQQLQSVDFYVSQPKEMSKYKSCTSYTSLIRLSMALGTGLSVSVSDLDLMTWTLRRDVSCLLP